MIALIMAGGSGTRFWPLSRKEKPKQFLKLISPQTMLQLTIERLNGKVDLKDIYIVTAAEQAALIREYHPELPEENVIIEPFGMNTAPCIALSILYIKERVEEDETIVVLPADHLIKDTPSFLKSLDKGQKAAKQGYLVTFGIKPTYPATGYGYIKKGEKIESDIFEVEKFVEKPNLGIAQKYIDSGKFYWNSGMFVWNISTIWKAFERHVPEIVYLLSEIRALWQQEGYYTQIDHFYKDMPRLPVDIAIMEKAGNRAMIPVDYGWSDVGNWRSLYDTSPKDKDGNVLNCKHKALNSQDNLVFSDKFVALLGVKDLVLIDTEDAILLASKEEAENVKQIVEFLKSRGREDLL